MKRLLLLIFVVSLSFGLNAQEKTRILCVGNSFTFVGDAHKKLEAISKSEGHPVKLKSALVGGYTFYRHLQDPKMIKCIESYDYEYDYVFLQNQSQVNALYARNPKQHRLAMTDAKNLVSRVRQYSPHATIFMEQTWSYSGRNYGTFGSFEEFDNQLRKGTQLMAKATKTLVSPIGDAFIIVRSERPDIVLYKDDNKHQNEYGSYLKACVNYLLIFRQPFSQNTDCCELDAAKCKYLQEVAQRVVLSK